MIWYEYKYLCKHAHSIVYREENGVVNWILKWGEWTHGVRKRGVCQRWSIVGVVGRICTWSPRHRGWRRRGWRREGWRGRERGEPCLSETEKRKKVRTVASFACTHQKPSPPCVMLGYSSFFSSLPLLFLLI